MSEIDEDLVHIHEALGSTYPAGTDSYVALRRIEKLIKTPKPVIGDNLRDEALKALRTAEEKFYLYACDCEVGEERITAFTIYENIRNAPRRD